MTVAFPISFHDLQGLAFGILMTSLGVTFLTAAGLITGQTAGVAVLLSYLTPLNFGTLFMLISLPFFWLSWKRRGAAFTIRSAIAVAGISVMTQVLTHWISFATIPPFLAAVLAGSCSGVGLIALFRHKSSAGGLGIVALIVEEATGFRTGWFQMCFDAVVFLVAAIFLPLDQVAYSLVGALVLNAVIAWNFHIDQVGAARSSAQPPAHPPARPTT